MRKQPNNAPLADLDTALSFSLSRQTMSRGVFSLGRENSRLSCGRKQSGRGGTTSGASCVVQLGRLSRQESDRPSLAHSLALALSARRRPIMALTTNWELCFLGVERKRRLVPRVPAQDFVPRH